MDMNNYMDCAKSAGYEVVVSGLGMGYIALDNVKLTETKDIATVTKDLVMIGMAIMMDTIRAM